MNILINGIGGPTPRSIAKRLRKIYPTAQLIGIDCNPKALGFYMNELIDKAYISPRADDVNYWSFMKNMIKDNQVDLAFVQPESEVLAWGKYYEEHGVYPCKTLIPPLSYTENLMDKARMAELLSDTDFIPKTITITPDNPKIEIVKIEIGFPCWVRASIGSGGAGSLRINREEDLTAWLFIHKNIKEFTVSEFLTGRHLANQMLYIDGKCMRNAGLQCVEYVMANIAPSKVTGNTSFGRFLNEDSLIEFCETAMDVIAGKLKEKPNGVFSFDLKEDSDGNMKITEVNIRHMAYTGIMADAGFDLIKASVSHLLGEDLKEENFKFEDNLIFLRDVDIEPILMKETDLLSE